MAISSSAVWEVRTSGNDANGGVYTPFSGTDYSQQNAAQVSTSDGVTDGTTAKVVCASAPFTSYLAYFGNGINIGGVIYQVASNAGNSATTLYLDRVPPAASGQTVKLGGALATLGKAASVAAGGNVVWVRGGNYTVSANITVSNAASNRIALMGYGTARGDGGKPVLTAATGCTAVIAPSNGQTTVVNGFEINCASVANIGIAFSGNQACVQRCLVYNFLQYGISAFEVEQCEVRNGVSGATAGIFTNEGIALGNYVHDNPCPGIQAATAVNNIVTNNTGAASDGIYCATSHNMLYVNNTCYNNGRHGLNRTLAGAYSGLMRNNLLVSNGGYGINATEYNASNAATSATAEQWQYGNNAYYANTSGANNFGGAGSSDVTLSASPFVNASAGNYALNGAAGGGAACRSAGFPGAFPGGLTTGFSDIGAARHPDPAGVAKVAYGSGGGYNA